MPTAPVKPYIPDSRRRSPLRIDAWLAIVVIGAFVAIAVISPKIEPGPFVSRVSVVNHSVYTFDVEVAGAKANDWTLLEIAADHATTSIGTVFDQGATWTFRFSVAGRVVGEVVQSRADLASNGWRVVIPDRYAEALRSKGVLPTA